MNSDGIGVLARSTLSYGFGSVINRSLSLLLLPLFTRYLTPEGHGVSAVVNTLALLLTGPFSLGTVNAIGVCYFDEPHVERRGRIIWTAVAIVAINASVLCAAGVALSAQISELMLATRRYGPLVALAMLTVMAQVIADPLWTAIRLEGRAGTFVGRSALGTTATVALTVWFLMFRGLGLTGLFEANALSRVVVLVALFAVTLHKVPISLDPTLVRVLIRVGSPTVFALAAFFVIDYADRLMLQRMIGAAEAGVYAVGYSFGLVMSIAVDAFGSAWSPYYLSFIRHRHEAVAVFGRVLRLYLVVFGFAWLSYVAVSVSLVNALTAEPFHGASTVVAFVALAYLLKGCYLIVLPGLYFARKLNIQFGVEVSAATLTVLLNLLLIPSLYRNGAAAYTAIAYLSLPVVAGVLSHRYLRVQYNDWRRLAILASGLCVAGLILSFTARWSAVWLVPIVLATLGAFAGIALFGGCDSTDRRTLLSFLRYRGENGATYGSV